MQCYNTAVIRESKRFAFVVQGFTVGFGVLAAVIYLLEVDNFSDLVRLDFHLPTCGEDDGGIDSHFRYLAALEIPSQERGVCILVVIHLRQIIQNLASKYVGDSCGLVAIAVFVKRNGKDILPLGFERHIVLQHVGSGCEIVNIAILVEPIGQRLVRIFGDLACNRLADRRAVAITIYHQVGHAFHLEIECYSQLVSAARYCAFNVVGSSVVVIASSHTDQILARGEVADDICSCGDRSINRLAVLAVFHCRGYASDGAVGLIANNTIDEGHCGCFTFGGGNLEGLRHDAIGIAAVARDSYRYLTKICTRDRIVCDGVIAVVEDFAPDSRDRSAAEGENRIRNRDRRAADRELRPDVQRPQPV